MRNSGGGTCGPGETVTVRDALRISCNIPFAELGLQQIVNPLDPLFLTQLLTVADRFTLGVRAMLTWRVDAALLNRA